MSLKRRMSKKIRSFDLPLSYKINESRDVLRDALNVYSNQGRLETRFGRSLFADLVSGVSSLSFFKHANGTKYLLAKAGTVLYAISSTGVISSIKTGLSSSTKHRGRTWTRGSSSRHIIAIESDGLFQYDGTNFTQLGQAKPSAPTVASSATTGTLDAGTYKVYLTYYSSTTGFESNAVESSEVTVSASLVVQDLTYYAKNEGALGNLISITYTAGATAGAETIAVTNNSINVGIATGVTTANQIKTIIENSATASALVSVSVTGTGTTGQVAAAAANLANGRQAIAVTNIPATAANATIDTVRVYLKLSSSADDPTYITEFALGTTSYTITAPSESTQTPPLANAAPYSGGGKYILEFNRKLVVLGNNTFKNDALLSEEDLPDAFNDGTASGRLALYIPGDGDVTGGAVGLYNNSVLDPYLVIFKKRSTHIYSEINGEGKFVTVSNQLGCVSHDTIQVKNGDVFFLSDQGWRAITNGQLAMDQSGNPVTLGNSDIDDIFKAPGYVFEVNRSQLSNAFSVYYSVLDQYMTWVPEGSSTSLSKTYVYEFKGGGFKPYQFNTASSAACVGEDADGDEVVFMSDSDGGIYKHSIKEDRSDDDINGTAQIIDAFAILSWMDGDDSDTSYNFRDLILKAIGSDNSLTVKTWINYSMENIQNNLFAFPNPTSGFILDVSLLDEGVFGDERNIVTTRIDMNRTGENIMIGFYQSILNANIGLVSAQLEINKNGNRNA